MKKRVARFIGVLLAASMLTGAFGTAALAEGENTAGEAAAYAAADDDILSGLDDLFNEAIATPEPTPEPTPAPDPSLVFENDSYYKEAMGLLAALGIFSGYEDGSMRPGGEITRAEMATVILKLLNVTDYAPYENVFTDVAAGDWHANIVQTAVNMQIVSGMGDGTFAPNTPVTYAQAVKMVVCALGYGDYAQYRGGWPTGYISAANRVNLTKNATGTLDAAAPRGLVAKLAYNTLLTDYPQFNGFEYDENGQQAPVYRTVSGETLGYVKYNLRKLDGVIEVTSGASMAYSELLPQGKVMINGEIFSDATNTLDSLIAHRATVYYTADEVDTKTVVYALEASKNKTLKIDAADFGSFKLSGNEITGITYYPNGRSKTSKTLSKFDAPVVIYNSQYLSASDTGSVSFEEFITPKIGSVTLIDNNNDDSYDVVMIEKYEIMTVAAATAKKLNGMIDGVSNVMIDVDVEKSDRIVRVTKAGNEAKPRNLSENDVAAIKRSASSAGTEVIEIVVTGESVSGAVTNVGTDEAGNYVAYINNEEYIVDTNAIDDIDLNVQTTFYLDMFGRIGNVASGSSLSGNEGYGWVMKVYESDDGGEVMIRLFTQEGVKELALADKVSYWGPAASSVSSKDGADLDFFLNIEYAKAGDYQIRLCKYGTNSAGEVKKLYLANSDTDLQASGAVTFDNSPISNAVSSGNLAGGYLMNSGEMIEIMFPALLENYGDSSLYSYATANSSTYLSNDGNGITFIAAEIDDKTPAVVLRVNEYSADAANKDIGEDGYTSADHSTFMLTKITETVNEDNDPIFILTGYSGGSQIKLTTNNVTAVYTLSDSAVFNNKQYALGNDGNSLWNAVDNEAKELYNAITPGDVFTYSTANGAVVCLTKLVDVNYLIENRANLFNTSTRASETRDEVMFGPVTSTHFGSEAILESSSWDTSFTSSKTMDACIIPVKMNGEATGSGITFSKDEPYDIYELTPYEDYGDSLGEGDFAFVRKFKGGMREIYIYRFTSDY